MISESTLINVFEMVVQRLNAVENSLDNLNKFLIHEARYKTNNILHGGIFNYPFEIENYKFDKKQYAYIHIKLDERGDFHSLYDILMSIFDFTFLNLKSLSRKQIQLREKLKQFLKKHYQEVLNTLVSCSVITDKKITTSFHSINNTLYTNILELILNHFVTSELKLEGFKTFNHIDGTLSIIFSENHKALYIDQLLNKVIENLSILDYTPNDITHIKVVGLTKELKKIVQIYDINSGCCDIDKQRSQLIDKIAKMSESTRLELRKLIIEHMKERPILPIFNDKKETSFLCDSLEPETTIIDHPFILIMPGANGANTGAGAAAAAALAAAIAN
jgi:hypothetical protein